jgi:hypothetical protein
LSWPYPELEVLDRRDANEHFLPEEAQGMGKPHPSLQVTPQMIRRLKGATCV